MADISNDTIRIGMPPVPPTLQGGITATANPVNGLTTTLGITATDDGPESSLTYTWSALGTPPAEVTFSQNSSNEAKSTVATFAAAGSYTLQVAVSDPAGFTTNATLVVNVNQTITSIAVTPNPAQVGTLLTQQFAAVLRDQFTNPMASQPTFAWSTSGGGTVSGTGLYTAGSVFGGTFTVTATASSKSGSSDVTIFNATVRVPTITTQPAARSVYVGDTATFSVVPDAYPAPTFQWRRNGTNIAGATGSSYTTNALVATDNGVNFSVVVTNTQGSVTSANALLTVTTPKAPTITTQPTAKTANLGTTATFTVVATGVPVPTYQWRRDGVDIPGANLASYTTPPTVAGDQGAVFSVVVSNFKGTVTSSNAALTVRLPPTITTQPANRTVNQGQTANFTVVATGSATLTYQWRKNGVNISGATSASYTTPATTAAYQGVIYTVVITNAAGTATSTDAVLSVVIPPTIATQPLSQTVVAGQLASFTVVVNGTPPFTYKWEKGSVFIPGATESTYTFTTMAADHGTAYRAVVTNAAGTVNSALANLTVNSPVTITTQPQNAGAFVGGTAVFNVVAAGTAPFTYQWSKNGVAIAGATAASYTTPATVIGDNGAQFTVRVSNMVGPVDSSAASLTVSVPTTRVFAYDLAGNRKSVTENTQVVQSCTYDALNRLTQSTATVGGVSTTTDYAYDLNGNNISRSVAGATVATLTWDGANRLSTVTSGGVTETNTYDYRTRRTKVVKSGGTPSTITYRYDGGDSYGEFDAGNAAEHVTQVRSGGMGGGIGSIVYRKKGTNPTATETFHYNPAVGHVMATTSETKVVLSSNRYDAWGVRINSTGSSSNRRLANTKERDNIGGLELDNHGFRYYEPALGRYLSRDPLGFGDGMNPYLYVHNNPINRIDPLGLWDWGWDALRAIGNVSSGIADAITFGGVGAVQDRMGVGQQVDRSGIAYKAGSVAGDVMVTAASGGTAGGVKAVAKAAVQVAKDQAKAAVAEAVGEATGIDVGMVVDVAGAAKGLKSSGKPSANTHATAAPTPEGKGLGVNDAPQRPQGPWTERDLERAKNGQGPLDMVQMKDKTGKEIPLELHHADQMPGSAIHEVDAKSHRASGVHGQPNQGVTKEMREEDRQLHWQMRGQEMGNPPPPKEK